MKENTSTPIPPRNLILELILFLLLVFPPLIQSIKVLISSILDINNQKATEILFDAISPSPLNLILQGLIILAIFLRYKQLYLHCTLIEEAHSNPLQINESFNQETKNQKLKTFKGKIIATGGAFIFLVVNSLLWNKLAQWGNNPQIALPKVDFTLIQASLLILSTCIAALYEEVLYRWYGPKLFQSFWFALSPEPQGQNKVFFRIEVVLVVTFALSHGYGGWPAIGNALVAGSVLRLCTICTDGPIPGFFAHLAYNLIQFILLLGI